MPDPHVPLSRSVLYRFFKTLLILYILVTLVATLVHVGMGFFNTRAEVRENLAAFHQMFRPILREGLYRFDAERWRSTVRGMLMSPFLTGIRIENEFGEVIELAGTVEIEPGVSDFVGVAERADVLAQKPRFFTRLYPEAFEIRYDGVYLGKATLYSCDTVVWTEVWRDFGGILFYIVLASAALWTALFWVGRRLLSRPLSALTEAVQSLDPAHPEARPIDVAEESQGEIRVLQDAFNAMVERLEKSVRQRAEAEAENRRLAAAIEQSGEMVLITDPEGRIRYANPALRETMGIDRETLIGEHLARFRPEDEGDRRLLETVAAGKTFMERQVHHREDGSPVEVRVKASPMRDPGGRMTHVVVVQHDLTQELDLERQLHHAQKLEAVGTLAEGIAHDFNNILFSIQLNAELTEKKLGSGNPARRFPEAILQAARRGRNLVRRILAFTRFEGEPGAPRDVFDLGPVVEESAKLMRATLPASIRMETNIHPERPFMKGDPDAVHQVVINLCTNAYQAMGNEAGELAVELAAATVAGKEGDAPPPGRYLRLTVTDTGPGVPPENRTRVFEPYFTTKLPGEGTGLGLAVVHGIVRSHGGHIAVQDRPGGGAMFVVHFPPAEEPAPEIPDRRGDEEAHPVPAPAGKRLLLVDDEAVIAEAMEENLAGRGYAVRAFTDPVRALSEFEADPAGVDVALCDLTMPEMNGLELSSRMRAVRPDLPIILCTGFVGGVDSGTLRRAGVSVLLLKPVSAEHLVEVVEKVFRDAAKPEERSGSTA
jgi:PAS domain S-box-containing protein